MNHGFAFILALLLALLMCSERSHAVMHRDMCEPKSEFCGEIK